MEILNPRKVRQQTEVEVDLGDGTAVLARREDMTVLVFEGRIPMPLLTAVQKMIDMPDASPIERIEALGTDNGRRLVDVLREHAVRVVITPKLTLVDDGNPDHLPVDYFDVTKLMAIWMASAVVPRVTTDEAATFRSGPSAVLTHAPRSREAVPPPTQQLDIAPNIEYVGR